MTIDIALSQSSEGHFDIVIEDGDLKGVDGFDTALYVSLFTDARATDQQVLIPEQRRGWLGNLASPVDGRQLGGLLWLTDQRRLTQSNLNEIVDYARKSLQWMVDDGVCVKVSVSGTIVPPWGIQLNIEITSKDGITDSHYVQLWRKTPTPVAERIIQVAPEVQGSLLLSQGGSLLLSQGGYFLLSGV